MLHSHRIDEEWHTGIPGRNEMMLNFAEPEFIRPGLRQGRRFMNSEIIFAMILIYREDRSMPHGRCTLSADKLVWAKYNKITNNNKVRYLRMIKFLTIYYYTLRIIKFVTGFVLRVSCFGFRASDFVLRISCFGSLFPNLYLHSHLIPLIPTIHINIEKFDRNFFAGSNPFRK
jgi:hypothetical protein